MKKFQAIGLVVGCFIFIVGCTGAVSTPVETPTAKPSVAREPDWQQRWEKTVAAARQEGRLRFGTGAFPQHGPFKKQFEDKFGIELEVLSFRGPELPPKITAERSAGLYLWDVISGGPTTILLDLKPAGLIGPLESALILPEATDPKAWRGGQLPFLDKDRTALGYNSMFYRGALINTDMVKPEQLTSFNDLLKPEWKGKIVMDDVTKGGPSTPWLLLLAAANDYDFSKIRQFLAQLVKQEPVVTTDYRLLVEWAARGKYPIALGYSTGIAADFKAKGAPVTLAKLKEGSIVGAFGPQNLILLSGALPHPNAAAVFINWLLSREGQTAYVKAYASSTVSSRLDVSATGIDPAFLEFPGEKIYYVNEKMLYMVEDFRKLAGEVLAPVLK